MANKKKDITREQTLQMRVSEEEYKIIENKANMIGLTTSNYMRMVCLNTRIEVLLSPQRNNDTKDK